MASKVVARFDSRLKAARLARLVFDADLDAGIVVSNFPDGVDFRFPNGFVIHLKRVLPTVLSEPNGQ